MEQQQISSVARARLLQLQTDSGVQFDNTRKCFVDVNGKRKLGLTPILKKLIPVAGDTATARTFRRSRARQSKTDPVIEPLIERFSGATMARCTTCAQALGYMRSSAHAAHVLRGETNDDKAHGLLVDYQLTICAARGGRDAMFKYCIYVDPCVGTLLEQFDRNSWAIVASQLPFFSSAMDVSTACDLICIDRATRSKLIHIELKSSFNATIESDVNYARIRGRNKGTALRGVPQSYLSRHQGQLLCTNHMVQQRFNFEFDHSCVMRVSPGIVRTYDLHPWYVAKLPKFIDAIALKTGKKRRAKRATDRLRVQKMPRQRKKKAFALRKNAKKTPAKAIKKILK